MNNSLFIKSMGDSIPLDNLGYKQRLSVGMLRP